MSNPVRKVKLKKADELRKKFKGTRYIPVSPRYHKKKRNLQAEKLLSHSTARHSVLKSIGIARNSGHYETMPRDLTRMLNNPQYLDRKFMGENILSAVERFEFGPVATRFVSVNGQITHKHLEGSIERVRNKVNQYKQMAEERGIHLETYYGYDDDFIWYGFRVLAVNISPKRIKQYNGIRNRFELEERKGASSFQEIRKEAPSGLSDDQKVEISVTPQLLSVCKSIFTHMDRLKAKAGHVAKGATDLIERIFN